MQPSAQSLAEADRIRLEFLNAGAGEVHADILQPAETLLDLYGEDIRARAYVTADPLRGEMMLRPDFTVPVVQMHMESGADPARYAYSGEVFRKQEEDLGRPSQYVQVGYELFGGHDPAKADAEVFALVSKVLAGMELRPVTGDIGILMAAVSGLQTTDARKAALLRHIWRPRRFRALLDRFGGKLPMPESRAKILANEIPLEPPVAEIGLRGWGEVVARIGALRDDAAQSFISHEEISLLDEILNLRETSPNVLSNLRDIGVDLPAIQPAIGRLSERLDALEEQGVDVQTLEFEGNYGRTTMEYYDGFVFGFYPVSRPDLPAVATGGRYDALTRVLGQGRVVPAVGGVVRPGLIAELRGAST